MINEYEKKVRKVGALGTVLSVIVIAVASPLAYSGILMLLWNGQIADTFWLPRITFLQSLCIYLFFSILSKKGMGNVISNITERIIPTNRAIRKEKEEEVPTWPPPGRK